MRSFRPPPAGMWRVCVSHMSVGSGRAAHVTISDGDTTWSTHSVPRSTACWCDVFSIVSDTVTVSLHIDGRTWASKRVRLRDGSWTMDHGLQLHISRV